MLVRWCRRGVFAAVGALVLGATSMAKIAGLSWRYDARCDKKHETCRRVERNGKRSCELPERRGKTVMKGRMRVVPVRRRDPSNTSPCLCIEQSCR